MTVTSVLLLRTNIDWCTLQGAELSTLRGAGGTSRRLDSAERRSLPAAIGMWNDVFGMTFAEYRRRLRAIAEINWSCINGLDLFIKTSTLRSVLASLSDFVVFPVDDDDWFSPDLVNVLRRSIEPSLDAVDWPDGVYGVDLRRRSADSPQIWRRKRSRFATNNYAVLKNGFRALNDRGSEKILLRHEKAKRWFLQSTRMVKRIPRYLSVTCKSPASSRNLTFTKSAKQLVDQLQSHVAAPCVIPTELGWAEPYVEMTRQLNRELLESGTCPNSRSRPPARSKWGPEK